MASILIIVFFITVIYIALSEHIKTYINLIALQGLILFAIAIIELNKDLSLVNFILIIISTLVFKAFVVPYLLRSVSKRIHTHRIHQKNVKGFISVLIIAAVIVFSYILSFQLNEEHIRTNYFAAGISAVLAGMVFIVMNKNILQHLIAYLVIENGIFILAFAASSEMPMLISAAVSLDIFIAILILGVFITRVGSAFKNASVDELSELKD